MSPERYRLKQPERVGISRLSPGKKKGAGLLGDFLEDRWDSVAILYLIVKQVLYILPTLAPEISAW